MKRLLLCLLIALTSTPAPAQDAPAATPRLKGARPSPRHKLAGAPRHQPRADIPAKFGMIPAKLSMWGNSQFGDCVSAEEAFSKAAYAVMGGNDEVFVEEATVIGWARKHGFLDGADLTEVMDAMARDGMQASDGKVYHDGSYQAVDWSDDATLRSAIFHGPVKIGVAAAQLEHVVGNGNGWVGYNFRHDGNEDHCVALCGYGTMADCCAMLGVPVPQGANPADPSYLLFTWDTIGVVNQKSLLNICGEAWLRTPTTPETPPKPAPTPTPNPGPTPTPTKGWTGTFKVIYDNGQVIGVQAIPADGPAPAPKRY